MLNDTIAALSSSVATRKHMAQSQIEQIRAASNSINLIATSLDLLEKQAGARITRLSHGRMVEAQINTITHGLAALVALYEGMEEE